jgi:hypothetical protein
VQGRSGQQRRVAGHDDDGAGGFGRQRIQRDTHRMPGTVLLCLHHGRGVRGDRGEVLADGVPAVTDHHDGSGRTQWRRRGEHVSEQRPPGEAVQHLRRR